MLPKAISRLEQEKTELTSRKSELGKGYFRCVDRGKRESGGSRTNPPFGLLRRNAFLSYVILCAAKGIAELEREKRELMSRKGEINKSYCRLCP